MAHGSGNGGTNAGNHNGGNNGGGNGGGGNNHGGNGGGGSGNNGGTNAGQGSISPAQVAPGLPGWLTASNGGTGAPIAVSDWLSPDYPGGYAGWLNDHPNAGHDASPPDNTVYRAWLQQHVGSDGQLHLPSAGSVGTTTTTTPDPATTVNPAASVPQNPEDPSSQQGGVTYPNGPGGPDYTDQNSTLAPGTSPTTTATTSDGTNPDAQQGGVNYPAGGYVAADGQGDYSTTSAIANPASTSGSAGSSDGGNYTVAPGDTLSGIAAAHGLSLKEIEGMNPNIGNVNLIHPGQTVNIGGGNAQPTTDATQGGAAVATDTSAFPTTSSYPSTDQQQAANKVLDKLKNLGGRLKGGSTGAATSADPVQQALVIEPNNDTNPLHIKNNGKS